MKLFAVAWLAILLAGCETSGDDPQTEAMIANAAAKLEKQADDNVNRMIAEIEAASEAPPEPGLAVQTEESETGDKAGIEKQVDDDNQN